MTAGAVGCAAAGATLRLCDYGRLFSSARRFGFLWSSRGWLDDHGARRRRNHHNWRATTAPAGALATTGPAGGLEAMAGVVGCGTMFGAERGCGTILRGAGRAGGGGAATTARLLRRQPAAGAAGAGAAGLAGMCGCRASSSSSFFFARMAFSTSPGLEMCERSIFGAMACGARDDAALPWPAERDPRSNCARTFSASSTLKLTGVGLACAQAEFRQYVKNLPALDFHLAREIVDTNLTHPPLFENPFPKAASRS